MEAIEGDLGLGKVLGDTGDESRAHVDRGLLDAGGVAAACFEMICKLTDSIGVATVGDEHDAPVVDVGDEGYVVLAALGRGLVDGDAPDASEIHTRYGGSHVVEDDAPHALIRDLEKAGGDSDRHVHGERHGKALEQQGEAGAGPRPGDGDEADTTRGAGDARRTRGEERLMLEEVEVPPGLLLRVVDGAAARVALRAVETATCLEIELDVEAPLDRVELGRCDEPRRGDAEGQLK